MERCYHLLEPELLFTKVYQETKKLPKAQREAACLKIQQETMLKRVRSYQKVCGYVEFYDVGLYHVMYGGVTGSVDKVGFCYDKGNIMRKLEQGGFSPDRKQEVLAMCTFWDTEYTNYKARQNFDTTMAAVAPTDLYETELAVVYPLYRLAEMQLDFGKLIRMGMIGLRREVEVLKEGARYYDGDISFYDGLLSILDLFDDACAFYIEDVKEQIANSDENRKEELLAMKDSLEKIRKSPPTTFREALQLIWLYSICAQSPDFNRLDVLLADFYCHDIANGTLTEEEATVMLSSVFQCVDEIYGRNSRVVVGGLGRPDEKAADIMALVIMEAIRRCHLPFPQLSLRMYEGMNETLPDKGLELLSGGLTLPVIYNDNKNIPDVAKAFDVTYEAAGEYSFLGCGEYLLAHRSIGTPNVIINMAKVLEITLRNGRDVFTNKCIGLDLGSLADYQTFDELFDAYKEQMEYFVINSAKIQDSIYQTLSGEVSFLFQSLLMNDCLSRGKAILDGGIQHLGGTYETYGNITASDSLYAIKKAVYDDKVIAPDELLKMMECDFAGYEQQLEYLLNLDKYGNDLDEVDQLASEVHEHMCLLTQAQKSNTNLDSFLVVEINNSANVVLGKYVGASADGRRAGDILSNANGPTQGMDTNGITALINSLTKMRGDIHAGITQNFKFSKQFFYADKEKLKMLLWTFFRLGGSQANINVVNAKDLEAAMIHPEQYGNLIIRVGGYSARFIDLDKDIQRDIIRRTVY